MFFWSVPLQTFRFTNHINSVDKFTENFQSADKSRFFPTICVLPTSVAKAGMLSSHTARSVHPCRLV